MLQRFQNSVVWITGGGTGIGRALAIEFAREGARVAISGRREDRLASVVKDIEALGGVAMAVKSDVTDEADVARTVADIIARFGQLDVAVANAGLGVNGTIEKLTAADWHRQLDTNVIGLALTARAALPHLRATRGRIVLVGSVAAMLALPGNGAYNASKYAVRCIGQTLSIELHGSGVTCTTIHPGFVASEIATVSKGGDVPRTVDPRPARLIWPTDKAARVMLRAIHRRKREFVFTAHGRIGAWLGRHLPGLVHFALTRGSGRRVSDGVARSR